MEPNKLNLHLTVELMIQRRRSPLGRFLPRLGPFVPRTAFFPAMILSLTSRSGAWRLCELLHCTFRHRILVGYRAEAEGVSVEQVVDRLLETVPVTG